MNPTVALTIAGSDPSGGAGIQADLTTFSALGVHGTSVITAVTAQNTVGVQGVHVVPVDVVARQLESVLDDLPVSAVKTGMLATEEIVRLVAEYAAAGRLPNLVVDPVMVASTGARLLDDGAEAAYRDELLPCALVATPNAREVAALGTTDLGAQYVVATGEATGVDRVHHAGAVVELAAEPIPTANDHGTGCTFAAATASFLAKGAEPLDAIRAAKAFVRHRIELSADWSLGAGRGPVAHVRAR